MIRALAVVLTALPILTAHPPAAAQPEDGYGRYTPTERTKARLTRLHAALKDHVETIGAMPEDPTELIDLGFLDSRRDLIDARLPQLVWTMDEETDLDSLATFRIVDTWRDGPIATTDLPRDGEWIVLDASGDVYTQPVDPAWLGRYTPTAVDDARLERSLDARASSLGAVLSSAQTDAGRRGLGVDAIIPGYTRQRSEQLDADLLPGDLILTVGGVRYDSVDRLEQDLASPGPLADSILSKPFLEIVRDGRILTVRPLVPYQYAFYVNSAREARDTASLYLSSPGPGSLNAESDSDHKGAGVRVARITSAHTDRYLDPGDIVLRVGDDPLGSYFPTAMREPAGTEVQLTIERSGEIVQVDFPLDASSEDHIGRARDEIEMGVLDLDAVRQRRDHPEHVGPDLWLMGLHQTVGPEAALAEADRLIDGAADDRSIQFRHVQAKLAQLARMGQHEQILRELETQERRERSGRRDEDRLAEICAARVAALTSLGDIPAAVEQALTMELEDDLGVMWAAEDTIQSLLLAGYPDAALDVARDYAKRTAGYGEFGEAVAYLEQMIKRLDRELDR